MNNRNNIQIKITPAFARLHAHICGDGSLFITKERRLESELRRHPRNDLVKRVYHMRYSNNSKRLLENVAKDLKTEFNKKATWFHTKNQVGVRGKWFYDMFKSLGAGKSKEWFIPMQISSAPKKIKTEWLKAFFDDEAHVSRIKKKIVLNIVNKEGLKQIQKLLSDLKIESTLGGPYKYKKYESYHLRIYRDYIKQYYGIIGFNEPNKQKTLLELVGLI